MFYTLSAEAAAAAAYDDDDSEGDNDDVVTNIRNLMTSDPVQRK